jgi:hypothetical protein
LGGRNDSSAYPLCEGDARLLSVPLAKAGLTPYSVLIGGTEVSVRREKGKTGKRESGRQGARITVAIGD